MVSSFQSLPWNNQLLPIMDTEWTPIVIGELAADLCFHSIQIFLPHTLWKRKDAAGISNTKHGICKCPHPTSVDSSQNLVALLYAGWHTMSITNVRGKWWLIDYLIQPQSQSSATSTGLKAANAYKMEWTFPPQHCHNWVPVTALNLYWFYSFITLRVGSFSFQFHQWHRNAGCPHPPGTWSNKWVVKGGFSSQ